jgi:hypothetical protein
LRRSAAAETRFLKSPNAPSTFEKFVETAGWQHDLWKCVKDYW